MIDLDEDSIDWKSKYPKAWTRVRKSVEEENKKEELQEAKRLGKKKLTDKELFEFLKNKRDKLILKNQEYILKKN
ncbi:hypothetical protein KAV79_04425 [Candidatus Aerophobetes bacterium]|nr:hypothetical protein [Candidatus Aerophobetes bacterium]